MYIFINFAKAFLENFIYLDFWSINKTHLLNFVAITPLPRYSVFLQNWYTEPSQLICISLQENPSCVGLINKYTVYNFGKS